MHIQEPGTILEYLKTEIKTVTVEFQVDLSPPYETKPKREAIKTKKTIYIYIYIVMPSFHYLA